MMPENNLDVLFHDHVSILKSRVDRILETLSLDGIVLFSGEPHLQFLDDQNYPFKVNPHFKAWAPIIDIPYSSIIYRPGHRPQLLFHKPVDYWYKPPTEPKNFWVDEFDITVIGSMDETLSIVKRTNGKLAFIGELSDAAEQFRFLEFNPRALIDYLHFHRVCKTAYEIECIRRANQCAVRGHRVAKPAFQQGACEYEIHIEYCKAIDHTEQNLPYENIIAINENGAVLHYQERSRDTVIECPRHSMLIDAGASFNGYAADITRTYAYANGNASSEFDNMIESMDAMQLEICNEVQADKDFKQIHLDSHFKIAEKLIDFEFVTSSVEQTIEQGISKVFYPHGLGHYLGLQVHDVGGHLYDDGGRCGPPMLEHPFLRITRNLAENQVLTIEPGIYFINCLLEELRQCQMSKLVNWRRIDEFRKFGGIRIEDNVVVTAGQARNLSREAFVELDEPKQH